MDKKWKKYELIAIKQKITTKTEKWN